MELHSEPDDRRRLRDPNNYMNTCDRKYQIIIIIIILNTLGKYNPEG